MQSVKIQIVGENIAKILEMIVVQWEPDYINQDENLHVYLKEEQYVRIESNLLSVMLVKIVDAAKCEVEVVTGGGQDEMGNDWGAENKQNKEVIKKLVGICDANSWTIPGINMDEYRKKTFVDKVGNFFDMIRGE